MVSTRSVRVLHFVCLVSVLTCSSTGPGNSVRWHKRVIKHAAIAFSHLFAVQQNLAAIYGPIKWDNAGLRVFSLCNASFRKIYSNNFSWNGKKIVSMGCWWEKSFWALNLRGKYFSSKSKYLLAIGCVYRAFTGHPVEQIVRHYTLLEILRLLIFNSTGFIRVAQLVSGKPIL